MKGSEEVGDLEFLMRLCIVCLHAYFFLAGHFFAVIHYKCNVSSFDS